MAENKNLISDKEYLAKILFTREHLEQKVVAKRVGVSEKTMSKWVNAGNWKALRNRLLIGKDEQLSNMYEQLANLNEAIKENPFKHGDSKQGDIQIKLTASIKNLETDLAIADLIESGIRFIKHLQKVGTFEQVVEVSDMWNSFVQASIKK